MNHFERVAHIADVHVRPYSRHDEFLEQFNNLYKSLRAQKVDAIILAGDIFDAKTVLSPESIKVVYDFFYNLSEIAPTYVIAGNHDANLSNLNRTDSIEAIVHMMRNNDKLIYLQRSGIYDVADNVSLGVFSILDSEDAWPVTIPSRRKGCKYIALYHAPMQGAALGNGQEMQGGTSLEMFKEYDAVLMGDIHKRQFLDPQHIEVETDNPDSYKHELEFKKVSDKTVKIVQGRVAYPGSLIQQNFGEDVTKGYLIWNFDTFRSRFVHLPNPHHYRTIRLKDESELNKTIDKVKITTKTRLKIVFEDKLTRAKETEIRNTLIEEYKLEEPPIINSGENNFENYKETNKEVWLNYSDTQYQIELLEKWLKNQKEHSEYSGADFQRECAELHRRCIAQITMPDYKNNQWKLNRIEFSNLGTYGENNVIDFSQLKGIVGLFSPNRTGKSTLVESLVYGITGDNIKDVGLDKFINLRKDEASQMTEVDLNGVLYRIKRKIKRTKTGTTSKVELTYQDSDGSWISDNDVSGPLTDKRCAQYFGSKEDFLVTSISAQEKFAGLIDAGDSKRLEMLYRFTNLNWFDELRKIAAEEIKDIEKEISILQKTSNSESFNVLLAQQQQSEGNIVALEETLAKQKQGLEDASNALIEKRSGLKEITISADVQTIRKDLDVAKKMQNNSISGLDSSKNALKARQVEIELLKKKLTVALKGKEVKEAKEILKMRDEVKIMEDTRSKANTQVQILTENKRQIDNKLNILDAQPWVNEDPNCRKCMFLQDAWKAKDEAEKIIETLDGYKNQAKELVEQLQSKGFTYSEINALNDITQKYKTLKAGVETSNADIARYESDQKLANETVFRLEKEVEGHAEALRLYGEQVNDKRDIETLELTKKRHESAIVATEKSIWNSKTELARIEGKTQNAKERLQQVLALEVKTKFYTAYQKAVSKNGMPFEIVRNLLPKINAEANQILSQTQDWKIVIHADNDKLNINIVDIADDECERPIETASGAERIITAIALRVAFTRISFLPRPTFFVIDEGFNSLDAENLMKVKSFFSDIKAYYDFILVISHVPQMADIVDEQLNIYQENRVSTIKFEGTMR